MFMIIVPLVLRF